MGNMWKFFFATLHEEQNTIEEIVTKRFLHHLTFFFYSTFSTKKNKIRDVHLKLKYFFDVCDLQNKGSNAINYINIGDH
jgi:hypothetical protein